MTVEQIKRMEQECVIPIKDYRALITKIDEQQEIIIEMKNNMVTNRQLEEVLKDLKHHIKLWS